METASMGSSCRREAGIGRVGTERAFGGVAVQPRQSLCM